MIEDRKRRYFNKVRTVLHLYYIKWQETGCSFDYIKKVIVSNTAIFPCGNREISVFEEVSFANKFRMKKCVFRTNKKYVTCIVNQMLILLKILVIRTF